jgi:CCR4-NOT transcription complex subunit 6
VPANQERIKVFSYNILCDNAMRSQYNYTPSEALAWDYRKEMILKEIQKADADIVCLQEVDVYSFEEYFRMRLAYDDYKGVFWPKARAKTMSEKDRKVVDGCATFYKGSKYILLDKQLVDFANIAINRPDMKSQHDIFNRVMPRDQMAIVTFFENRATGSRVIIANGHLYWDPAFPDVKLIQTAILTDSVTKYAEKYARWPACKDKKTYKISEEGVDVETPTEDAVEPAPSMEYTSKTQLPLIMCVDLNSTVDSSPYDLLSKGRVGPDHEDLSGFQYGNFTRDGIEHPFSLRSAYSILDDTPEKLTFTNYTPGFVGVIDHIFYSTNALEVTSLLGAVDAEYMKRVPGFPNYHFPSDHLSLLAEFAVKPRKEKKAHAEPDFGPNRRRD